MKRHALPFLLAAAFIGVPGAEAQTPTLIATYYVCSTADEGEADFIMNTVFADTFQKHVDAGHLTNWGWAEHQAGGPWRRISSIGAEDRSTAMTMWGEIVNELQDEHPNAWHRFQEICDSHVDYVWDVLHQSPPDGPITTWISTYHTCNQMRESRADEIMEELAAVYDEHVAAGRLGGWNWYAHHLGGRTRRLTSLFAAEGFDLMEARDMIIQELQSEHSELMAEMGSICTSHVDYLWGNARAQDN